MANITIKEVLLKTAQATKTYVDAAIQSVDVSSQLESYAKKTEVPTKTSQLTNDSGYLTSIPSEYVTDTELSAKGYLTEHQDISNKADKTEIPTKTSQLTDDVGFAKQSEVDGLSEEIANLPVGYIDDENTIILDNIENGTYTLKLESWFAELTDYKPIECTVSDTGKEYAHLIPENCSPKGAKRYGVYDTSGNKVGVVRLKALFREDALGEKLYSAVVVSDSHVVSTTTDGGIDLARAYSFTENSDALFTLHCGDVTDSGTDYQLGQYKTLKANYTKPAYVIAGNHDCYAKGSLTYDALTSYFGNPLYYSFEQGDDVYIMIGESSWTATDVFVDDALQFLYETLETYRNRRTFVVMHIASLDEYDSGNPQMFYKDNDIFALSEKNRKQKECFLNLIKHYQNSVWVHGHTHAEFESQELEAYSNYSEMCGYKSVHVPSITKPKQITNGTATTIEAGSQGYIMDVYKDCIVLKGRDFVAGKYLPIATFKIDTPLQSVPANTFVDDTGLLEIGEFVSISNNLTNATTSNTASRIKLGSAYSATLIPTIGIITSVTVTMGGNDITSEVYSSGVINIPSVTGDVVITAVAAQSAPDTTLTWAVGTKIDSSSGTESTSTTYAASNPIDIVDGYTYTLNRTTKWYDCKICYYDASGKFLSCTTGNFISMSDGELTKEIPLVSGAKKFRIRAYSGDGFTDGSVYLVALKSTTITASN